MKPEAYVEKMKDNIEKQIQKLEEKKKYYQYDKYDEAMYGLKYLQYTEKMDEEIKQWEALKNNLEGCRLSFPEGEKIWHKARFCRNRIDKFNREGYIMDDYTGRLLKDLFKNLEEIMALAGNI